MTFSTLLRVRFGDVDRAGIVYYPVVLHYCHVAFEEFFEQQVGIPYPELLDRQKIGFPTVSLDTSFESPFEYGMQVRAEVSVKKVGNTSTTWEYRFFDDATGRRLARSTNVTACVNMDTFEPLPVPDDLRAKFAG